MSDMGNVELPLGPPSTEPGWPGEVAEPQGAPGKRLTIYCNEYDRFEHTSVAQAILEQAREEGLAGATLARGIEGFGRRRTLHTSRLLSEYDNMPLVVQIVDTGPRIDAFMTIVEEMVTDGLITMENVQILTYRGAHPHPLDDDEEPEG